MLQLFFCYSEFQSYGPTSGKWHHICLVRFGESGSVYTKYYQNGVELDHQVCPSGPRTGGKTLQLGGGGRTESVEMTSFYLWDRMLSESEIDKEANKCHGGMGGPVVRWRDFYVSVRRDSSLALFVRKTSQCYVPEGESF